MGQIKVYGLEENINKNKGNLSNIIHFSLIEAFKYPEDKKFQRFFGLKSDDFIFPATKSKNYTIIEISIFEGRSVEAKKHLINSIYLKAKTILNFTKEDIEITIFETPKNNWGIRGVPGDELALNYSVNV